MNVKKKIIISLLVLSSLIVVFTGQRYFDDQLEQTTFEALGLDPDHGGDRQLASPDGDRFEDSNDDNTDTGNDTDATSNTSESGTSTESDAPDQDPSSGSSSAENATGSTSGTAGSSGSSGAVSVSEDATKQDIVDAYYEEFSTMQRTEEERVRDKVNEIKADIQSREAQGESVSLEHLQSEYMPKIRRMENQADQRFQGIYRDLKAELDQHGHDDLVAEEFRIVYENKKDTRRREAVNELFR